MKKNNDYCEELGKLNERYQKLIRRRYTEGATLKSMSQSDQSESSIKQALFRARNALIECVNRHRPEEAHDRSREKRTGVSPHGTY